MNIGIGLRLMLARVLCRTIFNYVSIIFFYPVACVHEASGAQLSIQRVRNRWHQHENCMFVRDDAPISDAMPHGDSIKMRDGHKSATFFVQKTTKPPIVTLINWACGHVRFHSYREPYQRALYYNMHWNMIVAIKLLHTLVMFFRRTSKQPEIVRLWDSHVPKYFDSHPCASTFYYLWPTIFRWYITNGIPIVVSWIFEWNGFLA